jgi:hypothetical protein
MDLTMEHVRYIVENKWSILQMVRMSFYRHTIGDGANAFAVLQQVSLGMLGQAVRRLQRAQTSWPE